MDFPPLELQAPIERVASAAELDAAAAPLGLPAGLPPSYRAFAGRYGYGLLGGRLLIFMPIPGYGCDVLPERSRDLAALFADWQRDEMFEYEPDGSPGLVARLAPFGISEDGHYLAWDPAERSPAGEHPIYVIGSKCLAVTRAAATLAELVAGCVDSRVRRILGPGYAPLPPTFRPAKFRGE
ncbi:MAG TPA: hypothetical protein VD886_12220 [Herpetosiphonaceae bacterium]|nr:hypothetical protein [Herpetosiphonaceae bacterium]